MMILRSATYVTIAAGLLLLSTASRCNSHSLVQPNIRRDLEGFSNDPSTCLIFGSRFTCESEASFTTDGSSNSNSNSNTATKAVASVDCMLDAFVGIDFQNSRDCQCSATVEQTVIQNGEDASPNNANTNANAVVCGCSVCAPEDIQAIALDCSNALLEEDEEEENPFYIISNCISVDCAGRCNGPGGPQLVLPSPIQEGRIFQVPLRPFRLVLDQSVITVDLKLDEYLVANMNQTLENLIDIRLDKQVQEESTVDVNRQDQQEIAFIFNGNATFEGPPMRTIDEVGTALFAALDDNQALTEHLVTVINKPQEETAVITTDSSAPSSSPSPTPTIAETPSIEQDEIFQVPLTPFQLGVDSSTVLRAEGNVDLMMDEYLFRLMSQTLDNLIDITVNQIVERAADDDDAADNTVVVSFSGNATFQGPPYRTIEVVDEALRAALDDTQALQAHVQEVRDNNRESPTSQPTPADTPESTSLQAQQEDTNDSPSKHSAHRIGLTAAVIVTIVSVF